MTSIFEGDLSARVWREAGAQGEHGVRDAREQPCHHQVHRYVLVPVPLKRQSHRDFSRSEGVFGTKETFCVVFAL
jgi:hypothetical protein